MELKLDDILTTIFIYVYIYIYINGLLSILMDSHGILWGLTNHSLLLSGWWFQLL